MGQALDEENRESGAFCSKKPANQKILHKNIIILLNKNKYPGPLLYQKEFF